MLGALEAKLRLVHSPPARTLLVLGYPRRLPERPTTSRRSWRPARSAARVSTTARRGHEGEGHAPRDVTLLPEGKGWLLVEFGGETKEESDAKARALMARLCRQARRHEAVRRHGAGRAASGRCASPAWAPPRATGQAVETLGRLGGFGGAAGEPRAVPARAAQALRQVRLQRRALRPLRAGLRAHPHQLRPARREGDREVSAASWTRRRDLVVCARRIALGRARRRAVARRSSCRSCSART